MPQENKKNEKPLKVGFDFDGVIMYNPARIIRPIISYFKRKQLFMHRKELEFFIPKTQFQKRFFWLLHQSSLFPAVDMEEIEKLVKEGHIEAYIITGRFSFLKKDFQRWLKNLKAKNVFVECYLNEQDEQPHLFKERMIKKLDLDIFIEDNWDIVNYLHRKLWSKNTGKKVKLLWIYNILDSNITYAHRFSKLKHALKSIRQDMLHLQKPRVLVVSDYFYPHWTGLSKSIFNLFTAIANKFEIEILTVKHQKNLKRREAINGFWIQRARPILQFSRAFYAPSIIARTWKKAMNVDTIFINSPCTNILPVTLIGKLLGKKVIIFHQGDLKLPQGFINRCVQFMFNFMTITAFSLADRLSTYSKDYATHSTVMRYYLYKTVPSLLPIPSEHRTKNTLSQRDKKQISSPVFGFAGRFVEEKGFDILFQAIPEIVEEFPNAHFQFAGQTKMQYEQFYEKHLKEIKKVKKYVSFLGLLDDNELEKFYRDIDLFLLPSRSECLGLVQAEAMLQGTPVVCSDIPGARELVKKTKFGYLFENENAGNLADTIIQAIKDRPLLMQNKEKALAFLEYERLVEQSKKLFTFHS